MISMQEYKALVSKEDYLNRKGVDLSVELQAMVNFDLGDDPAPLFIFDIEDYCKDWLMVNRDFDGTPTHYNVEKFKEGVIEQIEYDIENGIISKDSGYNKASGVIIDREKLESIGMGARAMRKFHLAGINYRRG